MLLIILSIILGFGIKFPQLYINDSYPNCQFAILTYTSWCYWYHVLLGPERDQLQNCLDSAFAKLENWLKANKHTKLNQMCHKQYSIFISIIIYLSWSWATCIYINLNIGYGNETIKFVITVKFLGV